MLILAGLAVAFVAIATTTGAGWPMVLVSLIGGSIAASIVLPVVTLVRLRSSVRTPTDAVVGRPVAITVAMPARHGLVARIHELPTGWFRAGAGELVVTPVRRGVVKTVRVEVRSSGPLGLMHWNRRIHVALDHPLEVAPQATAVAFPELRALVSTGDEMARGARQYVAGDPMRAVHWPSTARAGRLMVRELEAPARATLELVVDLGTGGDGAEEAASRAAGLAAAALLAGVELVIVTMESGGIVRGRVSSVLHAGRRMARAVPGRVDAGPASADVVRVMVGPS